MWQYVLIGIMQGMFEWIPISSEGIVALTSHFLSLGFNPVDLALFLHLGTFFAALIYFRKDLIEVITFKNNKLLRFLIIGTVISLIVAFPLYLGVRTAAIGNSLLLLTGLGLLLTAYFHKFKKTLNISFDKLAIVTGFLQGLSVMPGLSRSGSTIFGLSLNDMEPAQMLKISYIMSLPVVLASSIFLFLENHQLAAVGGIALVFSFLVGLLTLHILLKIAQKIDFFKFALAFGLLCIAGFVVGLLI